MVAWGLRLFGAKIGEGTYWGTTDMTEFDCIDVGDFCAITHSALQTHLYEDRLMKIGRIKLGTTSRSAREARSSTTPMSGISPGSASSPW